MSTEVEKAQIIKSVVNIIVDEMSGANDYEKKLMRVILPNLIVQYEEYINPNIWEIMKEITKNRRYNRDINFKDIIQIYNILCSIIHNIMMTMIIICQLLT